MIVPRPKRSTGPNGSKDAIFAAAALAFSERGFEGVRVEEIAAAAGVNKAMIYYHFANKLELYREVVRDMLRAAFAIVQPIAIADGAPTGRMRAFIAAFVEMADGRPWFPTLMLREMSEGAPHLDHDTFALMRSVFLSFATILQDGQASGAFRPVNPVLAYLSTVGPLLLNAARERAAKNHASDQLPMFVTISHDELTAHAQDAVLRMLAV